MNGYGYDATRNLTQDAEGRTFVYDAENKQRRVYQNGQLVGEYYYDGDGRRVKKRVYAGGVLLEETVFVYDAFGKLVAEYSTLVEGVERAKVNYLTQDNLGSPRILTDANGVVISRRDFRPFGEEIFTQRRTQELGYVNDNVRQKFTGYIRDKETNLDFAQSRYFSSSFGRYSSPDDFLNDTKASEPASWNLYVYARNNPLKYVDPLGKKATYYISFEPETKTVTVYITASIGIWTKSKKISPDLLRKLAIGIQNQINSKWGRGSFVKNGYTFNVHVNVSVTAFTSAKSYDDVLKADRSVQNVIEIYNGSLNSSVSSQWAFPNSKATIVNPDGTKPDTAQFNIYGTYDSKTKSFSNIEAAHEFIHLLGSFDPGITGSDKHLSSWQTTALQASSYDYEWVLGGSASEGKQSPSSYNLFDDIRSRTTEGGLIYSIGRTLGVVAPPPTQIWVRTVRLATN